MNILFLSTENPFPLDHGHHIRTYYVLKALAAEHNVHFVAFADNDSAFEYRSELRELCRSVEIFPLRFLGWRQMHLLLMNFFSPLPLIAQKYCQPQAVDHIRKVIREESIDLVHVDLLHIASYRNEISRLPCVLVNHNVESLRILRWAKVERNPLLRSYLFYQYFKLRNFEGKVCRQFDLCVTVSDYDKHLLSGLCGEGNFVTIPNGVDTSYFTRYEKDSKPNSLVWTGSMAGPYNRDAVVYFLEEIWPIISERAPAASVTFVGGSPPKVLKKRSRRCATIKYTGYVHDVRPYVADAEVFIAPLRAGSGTKIKILNAMAQGKPVVTTSVGAEGIDAEPEKEIIVADESEKFAERIVFLLQHPDRAKRIGLRARKLIERTYDWRLISRTIQDVYADLEKNVPENLDLQRNGCRPDGLGLTYQS
ncbi:glycosyltransferase [candidate division KSB1 bacterium]|nr:glycosyltransferase [candidate division KSB1 bacterium]NIR71686.1 glycosyltransferase [candidate division KSB1 bacterium]NIS26398.1 glycosyltransferase [candidate division KSB1 bacterium]NIT73157.1 glycosyltransferase [candidate division KSB1 bacterium]NIU27083.1 glycosyltransferase [candidate division KSB1 bacterium]